MILPSQVRSVPRSPKAARTAIAAAHLSALNGEGPYTGIVRDVVTEGFGVPASSCARVRGPAPSRADRFSLSFFRDLGRELQPSLKSRIKYPTGSHAHITLLKGMHHELFFMVELQLSHDRLAMRVDRVW